MTFTILANKYIDDYFIEWLIDVIRHKIISQIDNKRIHIFNDIVNDNQIFNEVNPNIKVKFDVRKAIILALNSMRYRRIKNVYIIDIGNNILFPHYQVKLDTVCRLLNYGNTQIKGYPIFSQVFNDIRKNLKQYYQEYLDE